MASGVHGVPRRGPHLHHDWSMGRPTLDRDLASRGAEHLTDLPTATDAARHGALFTSAAPSSAPIFQTDDDVRRGCARGWEVADPARGNVWTSQGPPRSRPVRRSSDGSSPGDLPPPGRNAAVNNGQFDTLRLGAQRARHLPHRYSTADDRRADLLACALPLPVESLAQMGMVWVLCGADAGLDPPGRGSARVLAR